MKLSIVTGTLNRLSYLRRFIASIAPSCSGIEHEVIIVDGGSTDGTLEWLRTQPVVLIEQGEPLGAIAAFNAGFWAAEGEYVANLNDDCIIMGNTLRLACDYLDAHPKCGQVAIPWRDDNDPSEPHIMTVPFGRQLVRVIYANFGVTRRELGDRVGWWGDDPWLVHYSGDCELSFRIMLEKYTVDELQGGYVLHYRAQDETRRVCYSNPEWKHKWLTMDVSHVVPYIAPYVVHHQQIRRGRR